MIIRWQFTDPSVPESYTFPISPNQMSSPYLQKNLETYPGIVTASSTLAMISSRPTSYTPREWTWGGVIRGQAMYDEFVRWFAKSGLIQVRDHFSRVWEVMLVEFSEQERRPSRTEDWRYNYTTRTYVTRRIS